MDRSAILHIPLSNYAFANTEKEMTIRIRAKKNDITSCTLYYGDRACNHSPVIFTSIPMEVIGEDELFEFYEITFQSPYTRVCYYFKLEKEEEWFYYYGDQFTKELPDLLIDGKLVEGRSEYYQYPFILREEVVDVPEWFKNAVVYNIFPDSFASGKEEIICSQSEINLKNGKVIKARLGGSIKGIMENLEYIKDLGFDCIYLNPIFTAGEYHKYDILDYYTIDPCFGSNDDFKELVNQIHDKDMHIIIDGVFNHCSWRFFAFDDVVKNGVNSKYKDWFYDLTFPVIRPDSMDEIPNYSCFAYERKMPKLNTSNKEVQDYFADVCRYWIKEYHIDGWRLDVANEISREFWRSFRSAAKNQNPEIVLIGEVWENSETWLRGDAFDSTMNYDFRKHCRDYFALKKIDGHTFKSNINKMLLRYPTNISNGQLNLLDSHDVPRFLSLCNHDIKKWKLSYLYLMLSPGVPSLFYGDEKEISGITENEYRSPMVWKHSKSKVEDFVKDVIMIRKSYINFQSTYLHEAIGDNLFAVARLGKRGFILTILNVGDDAEKIDVMKTAGQLFKNVSKAKTPYSDQIKKIASNFNIILESNNINYDEKSNDKRDEKWDGKVLQERKEKVAVSDIDEYNNECCFDLIEPYGYKVYLLADNCNI